MAVQMTAQLWEDRNTLSRQVRDLLDGELHHVGRIRRCGGKVLFVHHCVIAEFSVRW